MQEALHRSVVYADTERSGGLDDRAKAEAREQIHGVFVESLVAVGVVEDEYTAEDRGDGLLLTMENSVAEARLAGQWILSLNEGLRELNRGRRRPLRMRLGLNSGPVRRDRYGVSGAAVDVSARMANSDVARALLARTPGANLVVFVADSFYRTVIEHGGPYIEVGHYRPHRFRLGELDVTVWSYVPRFGFPLPSESMEGTGSDDCPRTGRRSQDLDVEPDPDPPAGRRAASPAGAPAPQVVNRVDTVSAKSVVFGINNAAPGQGSHG